MCWLMYSFNISTEIFLVTHFCGIVPKWRTLIPVERSTTDAQQILVFVGYVSGELVLSCFLSQWGLPYVLWSWCVFCPLSCVICWCQKWADIMIASQTFFSWCNEIFLLMFQQQILLRKKRPLLNLCVLNDLVSNKRFKKFLYVFVKALLSTASLDFNFDWVSTH